MVSINQMFNTSSAMVQGILQSTMEPTMLYSSQDDMIPSNVTANSLLGSMTGDDQSGLRLPMYLRCTATTICILLLMIGIPGNILVPYVVLRNKDLRNSTNIFLINLSVSDILVLIISTPTVLIELHSQPEVWFLGSFVCEYLLLLFPLSLSLTCHQTIIFNSF